MYKLENCQKVDMTSPNRWDPERVELKEIQRRSQNDHRIIKAVKQRSSQDQIEWAYDDPGSDEAILHTINPMLTKRVREIDRYDEKYEDIKYLEVMSLPNVTNK